VIITDGRLESTCRPLTSESGGLTRREFDYLAALRGGYQLRDLAKPARNIELDHLCHETPSGNLPTLVLSITTPDRRESRAVANSLAGNAKLEFLSIREFGPGFV